MSSVALLETLASVSIQITVLLLIGEWLHLRTHDVALRDRLRAWAYVLILLLTGTGLLVPHLRLTVLPALTPLAYQHAAVLFISRIADVLVPVWLTGCLVHLVSVARGLWRGTRLVQQAVPLSAEQVRELGLRQTSALFPQSPPELRSSSHVAGPFLWQFHRPIIVLPDVMRNFPPEEVVLMLRHEAAHLAARHPLELFLQRMVETVFWFHPSVRRAARRTATAREMLCDQAAVTTAAEAATWLRALIRLVESRTTAGHAKQTPGTLPVGVDLLSDQSLLRERTQALLLRFESHPAPPPAAVGSSWSPKLLLTATTVCCSLFLWLPLNPLASVRSLWSPWPNWSARTLDTVGLRVRDYEVDRHRLVPHQHSQRAVWQAPVR